ncbi:MAG TPA: hypothetical protein VD793_07665 [Gemmatimonadales bacterium]|nr:hypothetical protein [Gemmatimonadales bacterium]
MRVMCTNVAVLAALAVVACDPASMNDVEDAPAFGVAANGDHRVVGSGHVEQSAGLREFVFHALQDADGNAKGSYTITLPSGVFLTVNVTCMSVVGNTGWVAGRIAETNSSAIRVGSVSYFYAIDNGEGDGVPDRVSAARINDVDGEDVLFCANRPLLLPSLTVTDGNVQVR